MFELNMSNWHESYLSFELALVFLFITMGIEAGFFYVAYNKKYDRLGLALLVASGNIVTWVIGYVCLAALGLI